MHSAATSKCIFPDLSLRLWDLWPIFSFQIAVETPISAHKLQTNQRPQLWLLDYCINEYMRCLEADLGYRDALADNDFEEFSSSSKQKRDRTDINHNKIISMGNF